MPAGPSHMAARRAVIVNAAEALIREHGSTDFTMSELADAAGVSAATPFNLFESKLSLLYALLIRSLDGVHLAGRQASREADPFVRLMRAAEGVGVMFAADARFYRPLHQVLLGARDPVHRPDYLERAARFWRHAVAGIATLGLFSEIQPREQMICELIGMALGRVDLWVHGEIENDQFSAHMAYGALALTVGLTAGVRRREVIALMQDCRPTCPAALMPAPPVAPARVRGKPRARRAAVS